MYESFFGLTGHPFRLTPDPSFLFVGRGHRDAFAALQAGLTTGAKLMVLTGEVGAGKTTLLQALLASVDPGSRVLMHISAAHLDAETLSERLSEALDSPRPPDPPSGVDALLAALASSPRATLLVIDEAQHLTPSALDLLETLAGATAPAPGRLQLILVGQPELRILLNAGQRSGFRTLVGVDRHLGPLEPSEVRLYVEHRLHRAGWTGRPEFEDAAFTEIFIFTAGNPRRINRLCDAIMLYAWRNRQERIGATDVTWAAAAMREDSLQGAPDLLALGSHFERRPTLLDAFEPGTPAAEPSSLPDPALTTTGQPAPEAETVRSVPPAEAKRPQASSASPRRRQAILAGTAAAAFALALLAYVADRRGPQTSLPHAEPGDIVAARSTAASPPPAFEPSRGASGAVALDTSSQASAPNPAPDLAGDGRAISASEPRARQAADSAGGGAADDLPGPVEAARRRILPVTPAPTDAPTASCSDSASALGLCDADASSPRRK